MIVKGDTVRIYIPPEACRTIGINNTLARKYNNCIGVVSRIKTFYRDDIKGSKLGAYCEIEDLVSPAGVPYTFDIDWVSPVDPEEV